MHIEVQTYLLNAGADGIWWILYNIGKPVGDLFDDLVCELGDQIYIHTPWYSM